MSGASSACSLIDLMPENHWTIKPEPIFYNKLTSPMKRTTTPALPGRPHLHSLTNTPVSLSSLKQKMLQAVLFLLGVMATETLAAQCTMACNNLVNVSLPATCQTEIVYNMILQNANSNTCIPNGPTAFAVTVMDQSGAPIPNSPFVDSSYIGSYLSVKVKHLASGNSCWGNIFVEDKLPPQITCPPDVTVSCASPTTPAQTGTPVVGDCSSYTLTFTNVVQNFGCSGSFAGIITRTWTAVDLYSNTKNCTQIIRIAQATAANVQWPPNRDGISAPALDCVNPATTPDSTGVPTIGGQPIPNGVGFCNMAVTYNDQVLPLCENSYKILRHWTVVAWCSGTILNHAQVIAVKDTKPPVLTCPADLTVGTTSSQFCKASVILPPTGISDDCSSSFSASMNTPVGLVPGNGGLVNNINLGTYTIKYNVTDNCGNTSSCNMKLTVVDDDAPTVVCDEYTVVTLTNTGMAIVFAQTFDDGSYDNCGPVTLTARRMEPACGTQPVYGPSVKFCCQDVGNNVTVQMKATDQFGNANTCMVTVHVNDNSQPAILCPANKTLNCTQDPTNLTLTGQPTVSAACGTPNVTYFDVNNLNQCDVGTIIRTWTATLGNGNSSSCSQTITMVDNTPVVVNFPPNYTAPACTSLAELSPNNLPAPYNAPVMTSDCELLATSFTDQVFTVAAPACFKIVRTWKVINWCTYQPGGTNGLWQNTQIITVMDNTPPTFTCPPDLTVGVGPNCKASVTLPQVTNIQDCSQNVTVSVSSSLGNGYGPFQNVNPGSYTATYLVSDGCNNTSSCTINILVKDDKKPTPYCKNGLIIELMGVDTNGDGQADDGMATVWASNFNAGSFDNCPGTLQFSFSSNPAEVSATFDCDNLGQNTIQMWVTDASGNQDFCETFLIVQDNMGVCTGAPLAASVGGAVTNEQGYDVENVAISINDGVTPPAMTGPDGNFNFPALPLGGDYTLTAKKDTNLLNGVTTFDMVLIQRHILGVDTLESPYKIIAADINRSNSVTTLDLVFLQKVILFVSTEFPNNESWRFVDADYVFPNPHNPFQATFPEFYNINNFNGSMQDVDFIAVKIGDVNSSAVPNQFVPPNEDRSGESLIFRVADMTLEQNETYRLNFTAENFREITGYQFTLNFDKNALEFSRFEPVDFNVLTKPVQEDNFGFRLLDQGVITTSWNDFQPNSLPEDAVLFRLVFQARKTGKLSEALRITSDFTKAEAYKSLAGDGMELLDVKLEFLPGAEHKTNDEQMAVTVSPNPFRETTVIGFNLSEAQEATLNVFDPAGRLVKTLQGSFGPGRNEFRLENNDLPVPGLYFFRLQTRNGFAGGQVVRI